MGSQKQCTGYLKSHFTPPSSEEMTDQARGLFERSEFHSALLFQAAQGSSAERNQVIGYLFFWFVFFVSIQNC
ncbi:hypothetical protein ACFLZ5_11175 [Thermodesulfobacteriota bacterium]